MKNSLADVGSFTLQSSVALLPRHRIFAHKQRRVFSLYVNKHPTFGRQGKLACAATSGPPKNAQSLMTRRLEMWRLNVLTLSYPHRTRLKAENFLSKLPQRRRRRRDTSLVCLLCSPCSGRRAALNREACRRENRRSKPSELFHLQHNTPEISCGRRRQTERTVSSPNNMKTVRQKKKKKKYIKHMKQQVELWETLHVSAPYHRPARCTSGRGVRWLMCTQAAWTWPVCQRHHSSPQQRRLSMKKMTQQPQSR